MKQHLAGRDRRVWSIGRVASPKGHFLKATPRRDETLELRAGLVDAISVEPDFDAATAPPAYEDVVQPELLECDGEQLVHGALPTVEIAPDIRTLLAEDPDEEVTVVNKQVTPLLLADDPGDEVTVADQEVSERLARMIRTA